jgi:ribonuclease P protein component
MKAPQGEGFPRAARIRRRREFLALSRAGERRQTPHFIVLARGRSGCARLGVTVSRKVGPAVMRNRIKRRVREVFRRRARRLLPGHDVLVIARVGAATTTFEEVQRELAAVAIRVVEPRRVRT